jgi:hypothetical protein
MMHHPPQPGVVLADHAGDGGDRHGWDHRHQHGLEQQGEAAVWPRPSHVDGLDAAFVAADARHAGGQIGLVLEEVEVAPGLPLGVVGRAVGAEPVQVLTIPGVGDSGRHRRSLRGRSFQYSSRCWPPTAATTQAMNAPTSIDKAMKIERREGLSNAVTAFVPPGWNANRSIGEPQPGPVDNTGNGRRHMRPGERWDGSVENHLEALRIN